MRNLESILGIIFPDPYGSIHSEDDFQSCYAEFSGQFILSCCTYRERPAVELITGLKTSYAQMLNKIWRESLIAPTKDWIFEFSDHAEAAEIVQEKLMESCRKLDDLVVQSSICDAIAHRIYDEVIQQLDVAEVKEKVQESLKAIAYEAGIDLYVDVVSRNWHSILKSGHSNAFAKWCLAEFGPEFNSEFENGHPKQGLLTFRDGRTLEGELVNGEFSGKGVERKGRKIIYRGEFKSGLYHGQGTFNDPESGVKYRGQFAVGRRHGQGKQTWLASGNVYDGRWKHDKRHGPGSMHYENGDVYQGNWKAGQRQGQGMMAYANGAIYDGRYKEGQPHGQGKYLTQSGLAYDGQWKNGKPHGHGRFVWPSGDAYEGKFKVGLKHGHGRYVWSDGTVYDGSWKEDKKHGHGRYVWPNGAVYEGKFKVDLKHGQGIFRWKNGSSFQGLYRAGERIEGTILHEGRSLIGLIQTDRSGNNAVRLTVTTDDGKTVVFEYSDGVLRLIE